MKTKLFLFLGMILLMGIVIADNYYVTNPANCPTTYQSQTCSGSTKVCGYSGGITFCYDPSLISPPVGSSTTTGTGGTDYTCSDLTCSGGFVMDCYSYIGSAPYCTNNGAFLIDRNATCYNKHVQTTATGGVFNQSTCSATCTTNYFACDGSTTDANGCEIHAGDSCGSSTGTIVYNQCVGTAGNCTSATRLDCNNGDGDNNPTTCNPGSPNDGCEILIGGSCNVGSLTGTYANYCTGTSGTCIVSKSYFQTGTETDYQTNSSQAFLWGVDYYIGNLINITWSDGNGVYVNSSGIYFNRTKWGISTEADPLWSGNKTNMLDCPDGNYTYGAYSNGTLKCRSDAYNTTDQMFNAANNNTFFKITGGTVNGHVYVTGDLRAFYGDVAYESVIGDAQTIIRSDYILLNASSGSMSLDVSDNDNVTISGGLKVTKNISTTWFFGSINWSNVQNSPTSLSQFTNDWNFLNTTYANATYLKLTGGNITGNINISANVYVTGNQSFQNGSRTCYTNTCCAYSFFNTTDNTLMSVNGC